MLFKESKPANALILSSRGFIDTKNVGPDIVIELTNVSSVKLLGKKDMPCLGITLENSDIVMARMKKKEIEEMRENIEENLPNILISQKDVRASVKELKDIFVKFVREARILNNESTKTTKNNPFTTDDVLRAFGKLPMEPKEEEKPTVNDDCVIPAPTSETNATPVNDTIVPEEDDATNKALPNDEADPFYALLQKEINTTVNEQEPTDVPEQSNEKSDDNSEASDEESIEDTAEEAVDEAVENQEMSDEMKELMSRARSSKISELEKILNEKDIPTTHIMPIKDAHEEPEQEEDLGMDLSAVLFEDTKQQDDQQIEFDLSDNEAVQSEDSHDDNNTKKHDDMADTKEYFPDLILVNDSFEEKNSDDDSDFIIPDPIEYEEE